MSYYVKKYKYPSWSLSGMYPNNANSNELGLNNNDLENLSLGSWETFHLDNKSFRIDFFRRGDFEDVVQQGLEFERERIYGFAFTLNSESELDERIHETTLDDEKYKPLVFYDKNENIENYQLTSYPCRVYFGLDIVDAKFSNFEQQNVDPNSISDIPLGNPNTEILQISQTGWANNNYYYIDYGNNSNHYKIAYSNFDNPSQRENREAKPATEGYEFKPSGEINYYFGCRVESGIGTENFGLLGLERRLQLPNVQLYIYFPQGLSHQEFDISVLDRVKLFKGWDQEYTITYIQNHNDGKISYIWLDKFYPGDKNADAGSNSEINDLNIDLNGKDRAGVGVTNKTGALPAPFEMRTVPKYEGSFQVSRQVASAFNWGSYDVNFNSADFDNGGSDILTDEFKNAFGSFNDRQIIVTSAQMRHLTDDDWTLVIRRPISDNEKGESITDVTDFTEIIFSSDRSEGISVQDGNEVINLFPTEVKRSPRFLAEPNTIRAFDYKFGTGFQSDGNHSDATFLNNGDDTNPVYNNPFHLVDSSKQDGEGNIVSNDLPRSKNVTLQAGYGFLEADRGDGDWPKVNDVNATKVDFDEDLKIHFPNFQGSRDNPAPRGELKINVPENSSFIYYLPEVDLKRNTEFEAGGWQDSDTKYIRLKFTIMTTNVNHLLTSYTNPDIISKIGVGYLDLSTQDGERESLFQLDNYNETQENIFWQSNEEYTFSSKVSSLLNVANAELKIRPFIKIDFKGISGDVPTIDDDRYNTDTGLSFFLKQVDVEYATQIASDDEISVPASRLGSLLYSYSVLQWGDEKIKQTDEQLLESFYFNWYNTDTPSRYILKKYANEFEKSTFNLIKNYDENDNKGYYNITSHDYLTPGVKSIKAVVFGIDQYNKNVVCSKLVTTNIVINDNLLSSQDFSILGGTDYTFLPVNDNQVLINGFDNNSNYNNSLVKIVKDDSFVQEDYLKRRSAIDYIERTNEQKISKGLSQLDLGQTRFFNQPRDIYDFIGGNKLEWINQGSGSLPLNSLATDIFIIDEKCTIDLNPKDSDFSFIENKAGYEELGILIGDYKINQEQNQRVEKDSLMETPILEKKLDKQSF